MLSKKRGEDGMNTEKGLKEFVEQMKLTLDLNQGEKGDSWVTCDIKFLKGKLREEIAEYYGEEGSMKSAKELVDIANVCMMLYHRHVELWAKQAAEKMFGEE